ncbi:MAG: pilus assembly protein N-terminal domain-containing protein, partial [Vulcanimicrobiaceae bacterium]
MRGAAVRAFLAAAIFAAGVVVASAAGPATAPPPSPSPFPSPSVAATPAGSPSSSPSPSPSPAATATQPPIVVNPAAAEVPVGSERVVQAGSVLGTITAAAADPTLVGVRVDQVALTVTLTGKAPGTTVVTVTDQRGMTANIPVRVAYKAGSVAATASIRITGDPASSLFVKRQAVAAATALARLRPGAQVVTGVDDVSFDTPLAQDDVAT